MITLGLIGLALMTTRFARAGRRIAAASVILLLIVGFSPIGSVLLHKLESRFPRWDASHGAPDGIVVLGGVISPQLSRDYGEPIIGSDAGRIIAMAKLARTYPNARIIYSGGDASLFANQRAETDFVNPLLETFGIPLDRVELESRSRNTAENAAFSKALAQPKPGQRWLLVTSAQHMPRAIGCFRKAGFPVEAYPVAWHTRKKMELFPNTIFAAGLIRLDVAAHEWVGLTMYWLTGRTSEWLPGPTAKS